MSDDESEDYVRRLFDADFAASPSRHPSRTPNCLSTLKFLPPVPGPAWSRSEIEHAESCRYCQMMVALAWRVTCPGVSLLARFAIDPATSGVARAMALHLERDQCAPCRRLLASKAFARHVASRRTWQGIYDRVARLLDPESFGLFLSEIPALAGEPSRVMLGGTVSASASAGPAGRHHEHGGLSESGLELESDLDDRGNIVARAFTKDGALTGRRVWLALTTPDRTIASTAPLAPRGRSFVAETTFTFESTPEDYILEGILLPSRRGPLPGGESTQGPKGDDILEGVVPRAVTPDTSAVIDAFAAALRSEDAATREAAAHAIAALAKESGEFTAGPDPAAELKQKTERRADPDIER